MYYIHDILRIFLKENRLFFGEGEEKQGRKMHKGKVERSHFSGAYLDRPAQRIP